MRQLLFLLIIFGLSACTADTAPAAETAPAKAPVRDASLAKFEPVDGKCILFVGQELESIGGLEAFSDGYLDHFARPGGFTMYTKIRPGDEEFGFTYTGLAGVSTTDDWGDGPSNMSLQLADPDFDKMALAIGLELVNHDLAASTGGRDSLIVELGKFLKGLAPRPVFLRIGYEFAGAWNHYDQDAYIKIFRRIVTIYNSMGIDNVAYVWQSHGADEPLDVLSAWYPGDEYVDWCGYSFFNRHAESHMIEFARQHNKPVFIAEATPTITDPAGVPGKTKELILSNSAQAEAAWEQWFKPFFKTIHDHEDVVKAISYINCNWKSHRMWVDNPTFQDVDARLQSNPAIEKRWKAETETSRYLQPGDELYEALGVEIAQ